MGIKANLLVPLLILEREGKVFQAIRNIFPLLNLAIYESNKTSMDGSRVRAFAVGNSLRGIAVVNECQSTYLLPYSELVGQHGREAVCLGRYRLQRYS